MSEMMSKLSPLEARVAQILQQLSTQEGEELVEFILKADDMSKYRVLKKLYGANTEDVYAALDASDSIPKDTMQPADIAEETVLANATDNNESNLPQEEGHPEIDMEQIAEAERSSILAGHSDNAKKALSSTDAFEEWLRQKRGF